VVSVRNRAFDAGLLTQTTPAVPALSIGNVSVGGTGKTPVASWFADQFRLRGGTPAIVLRGYGADEPEVHRRLQPAVRVEVAADRLAGITRAAAAGCDVAVLDDAFQHRHARRHADVVLVSADAPWATRCLPCGPLREPTGALRRATLVLITRKAANDGMVAGVWDQLIRVGSRAIAVATLEMGELIAVTGGGQMAPPRALQGRRVLAVSGIANPPAFEAQLRAIGARCEGARYPDHHTFGAVDVAELLRRAEAQDYVVCTLKDAVKLGPLWPRSGPRLWYVSQRVSITQGADVVHATVDAVLAARAPVHR
jgi:tetraacyldisaccharide 4'-kinase